MTRLFASILLILLTTLRAGAVELVMVEQHGCAYCAAWDKTIAPIYPKSEIGKFAPLRRVHLREGAPEGVTFDRPARFTPTFVLIGNDGSEIGRIEGYPGEDFFWGLLEKLATDRAGFESELAPQAITN